MDMIQAGDLFWDCWQLLKAAQNPPDSDSFWKWLTEAADGIAKKYGESKLALDMTCAIYRELKRKAEGKKIKGSKGDIEHVD